MWMRRHLKLENSLLTFLYRCYRNHGWFKVEVAKCHPLLLFFAWTYKAHCQTFIITKHIALTYLSQKSVSVLVIIASIRQYWVLIQFKSWEHNENSQWREWTSKHRVVFHLKDYKSHSLFQIVYTVYHKYSCYASLISVKAGAISLQLLFI